MIGAYYGSASCWMQGESPFGVVCEWVQSRWPVLRSAAAHWRARKLDGRGCILRTSGRSACSSSRASWSKVRSDRNRLPIIIVNKKSRQEWYEAYQNVPHGRPSPLYLLPRFVCLALRGFRLCVTPLILCGLRRSRVAEVFPQPASLRSLAPHGPPRFRRTSSRLLPSLLLLLRVLVMSAIRRQLPCLCIYPLSTFTLFQLTPNACLSCGHEPGRFRPRKPGRILESIEDPIRHAKPLDHSRVGDELGIAHCKKLL